MHKVLDVFLVISLNCILSGEVVRLSDHNRSLATLDYFLKYRLVLNSLIILKGQMTLR